MRTAVSAMATRAFRIRCQPVVLACLLAVLVPAAAEATANLLIYGLTSGSQLVTFRSNAPGTILSTKTISGITVPLVGIDVRPATGQLFALDINGQLFVIDPATGQATAVGSGVALTPATAFGFDFNPTVDKIRVVSNADQNIRLDPITGGLFMTDTALAYAGIDVFFGVNPNVVALAYTNSFSGANVGTGTNLYGIDSGLDILVFQNPPNGGTLNTVGFLGVGNISEIAGFDIAPDGRAFAALHVTGALTSGLYTINLETGAASLVGAIVTTGTIRGLAIAPTGNRPDLDFDGDGKADIAVYRRSTAEWFVLRSSDGGLTQVAWGSPFLDDVQVPADYDGDGRADIAVYRRTTGVWFILRSSDSLLMQVAWGSPFLDDVPVPADYDGDGKTDIAVYRRTTAVWFILRSSDNQLAQVAWGSPALLDVPARP